MFVSSEDVRRDSKRLTETGAEVVSPITLVSSVYHPTLGEKITKYLRSPQRPPDLARNPDLWDPEDREVVFGDGDIPRISVHSERYQEGLKKAKQIQVDRQKSEQEAAVERQRQQRLADREHLQSLLAEINAPEPPQSEE